jgi:hypothetical protein
VLLTVVYEGVDREKIVVFGLQQVSGRNGYSSIAGK